jgi:hypothetical protein
VDKLQERQLANLRKQREDKIRYLAERIQEHVGYMLTRIEQGNGGSTGHYAAGIATDAHEIVACIAALDGAAETAGIFDAYCEPSPLAAKEGD